MNKRDGLKPVPWHTDSYYLTVEILFGKRLIRVRASPEPGDCGVMPAATPDRPLPFVKLVIGN